MKEIGKNVYKIVSLVGVGFVLTSFIVPEVIGVLAPSEYKSAIWATPPLLIGMFMYFIYCNFGNVEIYFHKQNAMLFSSVTVAVINIILDYILIQIRLYSSKLCNNGFLLYLCRTALYVYE